jgi:hypothetical protein
MQQRGRLVGEDLLRLVDLGAFGAFQPGDLVERQIGEQPQEAADIAVVGVPPELPIIIGRKLFGIEPDAPETVLPILPPSAVVISGVVRPNTSTPSIRRDSSMPLTIFPH